jgi:carboxymethylenebutenolidase
VAGEIELQVDGGPMRALFEKPGGTGPFPGIVVCFHMGGLDDFEHWLVEDLARQGFAAVAPDHYHWLPPGFPIERRREILTDRGLAMDLAVSRSYLECLDEVDGDRLGILGHCMGGRTTLLGAGVDKRYKAGCIWYGGSAFKPLGEGPSPVERIPNIAAKVMGFFGNDDKNPSPDDINRIDAAMTAAGIDHEFHRYDGTGHGFMNPHGRSYVESSARDSWARASAFLKQTLGVKAAVR